MIENAADFVLVNGTIATLDTSHPLVSKLAVKDGKVLALDEEAELACGPDTHTIDLHGSYVMPGLLDVHNHHMAAGQMDLFELTVPPFLNMDVLLAEVARYAETLEPDEWIVGGSWGSGLLAEINSTEALARFDAATQGRPALLKDDSKHNRWANSVALKLAGIGGQTQDPRGGQILRDASGKATGVLLESGGVLVEQTLARLRPESVEMLGQAVERGIEILHSYGVTGFQDAASSLQQMQALKALDDAGQLKAWIVTSMPVNDPILGTHPLGEEIIDRRDELRSEHHRPDFIKIFLDGVPPAGTAAFIEPYLPGVGFPECHCGTTALQAGELEGWLLRTADRGISAKIHCTGDASVRLVLDTVAKVRAAGYSEVKYHIAHGQFVQPDDIPRFAELDVTADISPSLWFPGVITQAIAAVLPAERASRMQPNRALLDTGARIAGGSDWPVSISPNPWEGIYGLVTRMDPTGMFAESLWPEQAISLDEAISIYTTWSAEAMGLDDVTGALTPGKSADFVVLSANPHEIDVDQVRHITATETWFAGQKVYAGGPMPGADPDDRLVAGRPGA